MTGIIKNVINKDILKLKINDKSSILVVNCPCTFETCAYFSASVFMSGLGSCASAACKPPQENQPFTMKKSPGSLNLTQI